ncbi:class I SAM-dependent methyltransferase [Aurantiacibacter aquimixticola]|uniref:Methyltransferase n=1 Tax=Aurantiacibacter aquimixticola TaxID=1958945 RepID=A0A419RTS3_9SPHN|nr:methyltransferase [Aurantiacibacter aquimixticola]RJY09185.1 methyltransferase [Aurantiacibacter aquimixticola]
MKGNDLARERRPGLRSRMMRALGPAGIFFRGFLEEPRMVGSVIPSSRVTIDAMLAPVDWDDCKLFVEYGPGVGTFCQPVLDRLARDGELLVIDTNPLFIDYLKRTIRDSRFHAVLGSAEDVEDIVRMIGHEKADYVLSGLPFSTLPEGVGNSIVEATHRVIREGGAFLTYQFKGVARDLTARHFPRVDTGFTWLNIPPCVLAWGWKDDAEAADRA